LTILKSDLTSTGLTASANNRAEQLLSAVLKKAATSLTPEARDGTDTVDPNLDQNVALELQLPPSFVSKDDGTGNFVYFERNTYSVQLDKPYASQGIDPDDY
jgi:hypothetical protein